MQIEFIVIQIRKCYMFCLGGKMFSESNLHILHERMMPIDTCIIYKPNGDIKIVLKNGCNILD